MSNSVCIVHIYDESVCDMWVTATRMQEREQTEGGRTTGWLQKEPPWNSCKEKVYGEPARNSRLGDDSERPGSCLPTCDRRCCQTWCNLPDRPRALCCTSLQKKASPVQTFYPRHRLFRTFPYRDKPIEMESCFSRVILASFLEIVGLSGWPLRFLRSA